MTYTLLETTDFGRHFYMGLASANLARKAPKPTVFGEKKAIAPFKVIQGHRF